MSKLLFDGKVAIITGAAEGIGFATAKAFAENGAKVALADINEKLLEKSVNKLSSNGYDVIGITCDVAIESEVKSMVEELVETFGKLDIAYNNVGVHAPVAEIADSEGSDFDRVIAVNLKGMWSCMKYELIQMNKQKSGAIVNCSSQSGLVGTAGIAAYTASKHGVIGLTKSAALEYASKGIRINAICPGTTDTPMVSNAAEDDPEHMKNIIDTIPLGRMGKAEEIASAVLWLCSENAGFAIGQIMALDGGYTIM